MSFAQRMHPIRAAYEARIADGKFFVKKILIPHIFILVFFILYGTFSGEQPRYLLTRLLTLAYPSMFTLWIATTGSNVSLRFVSIYLGLFSLLLSIALITFSFSPVMLLYFPIAVLIIALYPLALPLPSILLGILPSLVIVFLSEIARFILDKNTEYSISGALLSFIVPVSLLIATSKLQRVRGWHQKSTQTAPKYRNVGQIRSRLHKENTSVVEAARWLIGFRNAWNLDLSREITWRIMLVTLSSHTLIGITYTFEAVSQIVAGLISLSLIIFQIALFIRMVGDSPKKDALTRSVVFLVGSYLPVLLVISLVSSTPTYYKILFFVIYSLSISILPWNIKAALGLFAISIASVVFVFGFSIEILPVLIIAAIIMLIVLKVGMFSYISIATRSAANLLGRYCLLFRDPKEVMELFSLTIAEIGGSDNPLLISSSGEAYVISNKENSFIQSDPLVVQSFLQVINDLQRDEGLLYSERLSEQHRGFLLDCFDAIPSRLIFFSVNGVVKDKEEVLTVLLPVNNVIRIYGLTRFIRSISALFLPVKLSLNTVRGHYISTDHYASQQRSISEREEEINEMVHLVNNSAQDIAIHCEVIRQYLTEDENIDQHGFANTVEDVFQQIMQIELCARTLSEGVSDIKLVRELMSLKNLDHVEVVPVRRLLEDLHNFANYRARRRGEDFNLVSELSDDQGVKVASRDFMETVLRLLVRIAGRRIEGHGRVDLKVYRDNESIVFLIRDNGNVIDQDSRSSVGLTFHPSHSGVHGEEYLRAVGDFARFSKGSFSFEPASNEYNNSMKLTLPAADLPVAKIVTPGQWALLVDDNRQVTTFYARVAEALKLRSFTAVSVDEARNILTQEGKPRLVITDIQLDGSSGIDVVRDVRQRYGDEVPIVVVSGQADDSLSRQVIQAGANKCLTKPVGRRKLFAEIEEIL